MTLSAHPLTDLQCFVLPTAVTDEERLMVDVEIWTMLMELTICGARRLEASLRNAATRWADLGTPRESEDFHFLIPTPDAWQEQLEANRRLGKSLRRRCVVSDRLRWYQCDEGGCVSPNELGAEWLDELCTFDSPGECNFVSSISLTHANSSVAREIRERMSRASGCRGGDYRTSDMESESGNVFSGVLEGLHEEPVRMVPAVAREATLVCQVVGVVIASSGESLACPALDRDSHSTQR